MLRCHNRIILVLDSIVTDVCLFFLSQSFEGLLELGTEVFIECFHSHGQHICKFIETKESVCIRKEFNSYRIGLEHQHGHRFIVLGHQYGRRDVMWKHSTQCPTLIKGMF